jgi:dTDP-glucose 4,6-dehydratase
LLNENIEAKSREERSIVQRIVVIGSNSFSGSNFVHYVLEKGFTVLGISRSQLPPEPFWPLSWRGTKHLLDRFEFVQADLNNQFSLIKEKINLFKPSLIVNFAALGMVAESWQYPVDYYRTNLLSQVALHDYLRTLPYLYKYIHVSTPEVYGNTEGEVSESASFLPSTPYAASRAACDLHLRTFFKEYAFPVVWTRAANVYGPGQQLYRIIPRTMLSLRLKRKLPLHGGGVSIRSFIHIHDVCRATLAIALQAEPGSCFHLATKQTISIIGLVKAICKMMGGDFDSLVESAPERPGKDPAYLLKKRSSP